MRHHTLITTATIVQSVRRHKFVLVGFCLGVLLASFVTPIWQRCARNDVNTAALSSNVEDDLLAQSWYDWNVDILVDGDYTPLINNRSKHDQSSEEEKSQQSAEIQSQFHQRPNVLVRDKKLKFYRPRFHYNELKIKSRLFFVAILTREFLAHSEPFSFNQRRRIVSEFVNQTVKNLQDYDDEDIVFFYPQFLSNGTFTDNFIVQRAKNIEVFHREDSGLGSGFSHREALRYLAEKNFFDQYGFVFLFTDQTWISVANLQDYLDKLSVTDSVLSVSNGVTSLPDFDYLQENFLLCDSVVNNGLLLSSSLALKCSLDINCYLNEIAAIYKTQNQTQDGTLLFEGNRHFWHSGFLLNEGDFLSISEKLANSITVFPVRPLSRSASTLQLISLWSRIQQSQSEIRRIEDKLAALEMLGPVDWPLAVVHRTRPRNRYEVLQWSRWNRSHHFMPDEFRVVRPLTTHELQEFEVVEKFCWKNINSVGDSVIESFYRRVDANRGIEYIVDTPTQRIEILKPLNSLELIENSGVATVSENIPLTIVVPIRGSDDGELGVEFLNNYSNICLNTNSNHGTSVIIVLIYERDNSTPEVEQRAFEKIKKAAFYVQDKFGVKIGFVDVRPPPITASNDRLDAFPSSLVYLDLIARSLALSPTSGSTLVLHCRPEMLFTLDMLNRVRVNTLQGKQLFSLIPFQEFQLRTSESNTEFVRQLQESKNLTETVDTMISDGRKMLFDVRKNNGFFDANNFEHLSFYVGDYLDIRKQQSSILPLVRSAAILSKYASLYYKHEAKFELKKFVTNSKTIHVMRSVEPDLRLPFRRLATSAGVSMHIASKQKLAALVEEHRKRSGNIMNSL